MKKLNFAEMGRALTRTEMKKIMAGSGSGNCGTGAYYCSCDGGCYSLEQPCACCEGCGVCCGVGPNGKCLSC